jgi:FkbH-like protein
MNFLEAHRLVREFSGGPELPFLIATSGAADKLMLFLRAEGARHGFDVSARALPFNTLAQSLLAPSIVGETEVFLLLPWDFVPEADWRSGVSGATLDAAAIRQRATEMANRIRQRPKARVLYLPAPVPPLFPDPAETVSLEGWLGALTADMGADVLPAAAFSLSSYLSSGCPFASAHLGGVAGRVISSILRTTREPGKVLVTDLDGVMWSGVVGEDGVEGIRWRPEGLGFRHFLYQTLLAKLKREGTLLAAVSRNDPDLANAPFRAGGMPLRDEDFVVIVASYHAKSAQIREIARQLNLGLDSFVFVDDNPVEVAEVRSAIPELTAIPFPNSDDALPSFFAEIAAQFPRTTLTVEDSRRTDMYRSRLAGMVPEDAKGAELTDFLLGLEMELSIRPRTAADFTRAVQLINKTNQFNLNGRRVTEDEVSADLAMEARLFTAALSDRTGSHGEILACLISADGAIRSFVMSCRVFQRRVEYAFLTWLLSSGVAVTSFDFVPTARNEPIRQFLSGPAFWKDERGLVRVDVSKYLETHGSDLALFRLAGARATLAVSEGP